MASTHQIGFSLLMAAVCSSRQPGHFAQSPAPPRFASAGNPGTTSGRTVYCRTSPTGSKPYGTKRRRRQSPARWIARGTIRPRARRTAPRRMAHREREELPRLALQAGDRPTDPLLPRILYGTDGMSSCECRRTTMNRGAVRVALPARASRPARNRSRRPRRTTACRSTMPAHADTDIATRTRLRSVITGVTNAKTSRRLVQRATCATMCAAAPNAVDAIDGPEPAIRYARNRSDLHTGAALTEVVYGVRQLKRTSPRPWQSRSRR